MRDAGNTGLVLGIVGTGVMGRGIAQIAAAAGVTVRLFDAGPGLAEAARAAVAGTFDMLAGKGKLPVADAAAATRRLHPVAGEQELAGCDVVVEAIVEQIEAKRSLFARLEEIVGEECVLATNTSSFSVTAIAAPCKHPGRVAGLHFFNPVPLMKVIEVIPGLRTEDRVTGLLCDLARRFGHTPVVAADTPGFIVNHASRGYGTEALLILQESVAPYEEIDRILRDVCGFRMGPFELYDVTGLDVSHPAMESIYGQFYQEPRYRPSYRLRQRHAAGLLGRKSGQGFYDYSDGAAGARPPSPPVPAVQPRPVWVGGTEEPSWQSALEDLVTAAGWPLDATARPGDSSLCLLAPLGWDATSAALAAGIDPARAVAVDLLFGLDRRRTLMTNPATLPEFRDAAHALLAADGTPVSAIRDSAGFVGQRVIASIVNIACDIAQQGIAGPQDIDHAVTLGLGYPRGPLDWGDALGAGRILAVLEAIQRMTGDPRYRPSPWLSRRARLGVSLLTAAG